MSSPNTPCRHCGDTKEMLFCDCPMAIEERDSAHRTDTPITAPSGAMRLLETEIPNEQYNQLLELAKKKGLTLEELCREIFTAGAQEAQRSKETIDWITDGTLPDSDTTVLICDALDGEVDTGFHDVETWRWCHDVSRLGGPIKGWAHLPEGPQP